MALQILNAGDRPAPDELADQMRERIEATIPDARAEVRAAGPGHFEIRVVAAAFEGKSRVQQQRLVYGAITDLMAGHDAPVHAIDRLECVAP